MKLALLTPLLLAASLPAAATDWGMRLWLVTAIGELGLLLFTFLAWKNQWWRATGRIAYTLVTLAMCSSLLWLHHWNLL